LTCNRRRHLLQKREQKISYTVNEVNSLVESYQNIKNTIF
jgi:hypothetical protein